jgi:hypothetical protein
MFAASDRVRLWVVGGCLAAAVPLYVGLAIVVGSVPAGFDGNVGFSLASAGMFRNFIGLPTPALSPAGFSRAMVLLLLGLWALWLGAVVAHAGLPAPARGRLTRLVLAGAAMLLALVVVLMPPVLSADLFRQAIYGQMVARFGENPYETPASAMAGNALLAFANQTETTTLYGPVYTWLSAAAVAIAPDTPLGIALAWKTMSALATLVCVRLAAPVARAVAGGDEDGTHAQLLLAWNPLVIVEAAGAAHIEPIMMAFALAGLFALLARGKIVVGSLALLASALTKWVTGVLLVLVWAREIRRADGARARLRMAARLILPALLAALVLYGPFLSGLATGGGIHELALRGGAQFGDLSRRFPPQWLMMTGFAVIALAGTVYAMRHEWPRVIAVAAVLLVVFVVAISPWIFPWYFVAPVVLAAILPRDKQGFVLRLLCFGLAGAVMLFYARLRPLP